MEITLRHAAGLPAIEAVARHVPRMRVGAGTVTRAHEMRQIQEAGAQFALSPGMTESLVRAAHDCQLPFMPGVMTPGEVMQARDWGFQLVKLFPAAQAGGLSMLKALAGPLADMSFCPTGGVSSANLLDFLNLPNVSMVGGSWLTPVDLLERGQWSTITRMAREATTLAQSAALDGGTYANAYASILSSVGTKAQEIAAARQDARRCGPPACRRSRRRSAPRPRHRCPPATRGRRPGARGRRRRTAPSSGCTDAAETPRRCAAPAPHIASGRRRGWRGGWRRARSW